MRAHTHTHTQTHTHTHTNAHAHAHTRTRAHTRACGWVCMPPPVPLLSDRGQPVAQCSDCFTTVGFIQMCQTVQGALRSAARFANCPSVCHQLSQPRGATLRWTLVPDTGVTHKTNYGSGLFIRVVAPGADSSVGDIAMGYGPPPPWEEQSHN